MATSPGNRLMPTLRRVVLAGTSNERTDGHLLGAFVTDRDGDAFAGLVRRHGPMVLGVCRRVIGDVATAEDAFQAVFLVLARRAGTIKPRGQVGNWLYGVAYRTSLKARAVQARRRSREKQVEVMPERPVRVTELWSDVQPLLDEELSRLPDKLRLPIVLCDLEGRSQREVARHLGVPAATLATRLASARRTLAERLTRRGVTLSGGALAGLLTAHGTVAAVSHSVAYGLAQAAEAVAGGGLVTSLVSPHAIQLSEGVMRMMFLTKLKMVAVAVLAAVALTGGFGIGLVPAAAGDDQVPGSTGKPAITTATPAGIAPINQATDPQKVVLNERNFDFDVDDATFLRRLTLDLRGDLPTPVEMWFFVADRDTDKRTKVAGWMVDDKTIVAHLAKKLAVPADKIRVLRVATAQEGKPAMLVTVAVSGDDEVKQLKTIYRRQRLLNAADNDLRFTQLVSNDQERVRLWETAAAKASQASGVWRVWDAATGKPIEQKKTGGTTESGSSQPQVTQRYSAMFAGDNTEDNRTFTFKDVTADAVVTYFVPFNLNNLDWAKLDFDQDGWPDLFIKDQVFVTMDNDSTKNSDVEFLKRVLQDVRGTPPTSLEEKYFSEDKDPKKREKLLDTLLKDPVVAKKLGDDWKKKILESHSKQAQTTTELKFGLFMFDGNDVVPVPANPQAPKTPAAPAKRIYEYRTVPMTPKTPQPPADPTKPVVEVQLVPKAPQPPTEPAKPVFEYRVVPAAPKTPQPPADPTKPVVEVQLVPKAPQPPTEPAKPVFEYRVVPAAPKTPQPGADPTKPVVEVQVVPAAPKAPKAPQPPTEPAKPGFEWKLVPVVPKTPQPPASPAKPVVEVQVPADPKATQPRRVIIEEDVVRVPVETKNPQQPVPPRSPARQTSRLEKLVGELLAAKKTDAEMLEAVTLATVGRLPTDVEKRLTLGLVAKAGDRAAAWIEVAKALSGTDEGTKPAVSGVFFTPKAVEAVPAPPSKP
jgi:RNA polymerase sigma factor (sigma-70 family)